MYIHISHLCSVNLNEMDRKEFLSKSLITASLAGLSGRVMGNVGSTESTYDKLKEQVGFNHLPSKEKVMNNMVIHKANTRGHADHGWLNTHHTFSFANYYNPERMNFGVLRVLNDDIVAPARGFGRHPHDNMEIISIPLSGDLEHQDSMGNTAVIKQGDVQVMSAGTGIFHSEYNKNSDQEVRFLQIWLFPNKKNVVPRYDQISLREVEKRNEFFQILSPNSNDQGVWIHQNAWFHMAKADESQLLTYSLKDSTNGVYLFVLDGEVEVNGQKLTQRDGTGLWNIKEMNVKTLAKSELLLMEVPMSLQTE